MAVVPQHQTVPAALTEEVSIAYVDDSEDDHFLAIAALEATGRRFCLRSAVTAVELWSTLEQLLVDGEPLPDVLVIDLKMPRIDGHQLLAALATDEVLGEIPMFVLTTSADPRDVEQVSRHGVIEYLVKPSTFDELVGVFGRILDAGRSR